MKRDELHEGMKADFKSKFPHRLDFEREVFGLADVKEKKAEKLAQTVKNQ